MDMLKVNKFIHSREAHPLYMKMLGLIDSEVSECLKITEVIK